MFNAEDLTLHTNNQLKASKGQQAGFELDDIIDYPLASIVDLGTSIADSLTLGQFENEFTNTGLALKSIDQSLGTDSYDFYESNQDLVHITSLVGGAFVPGMAGRLAAKSYSALSGGGSLIPKAYTRLDRANKVNNIRAKRSFKQAGEDSIRYRDAVKNFRTGTIAQGAVDGVVFEIGFLALMNKHAYIEDNYDIGDFAIGAALGTLVGPVKWIMQNHELKQGLLETSKAEDALVKQTIDYKVVGETKGHVLGNYSLIYRHTGELDNATLSRTKRERIRINNERTLVAAKQQVDSMSADNLGQRLGTGKKSENYQQVLDGLQYDNIFTVAPQTMLTKMAIDSPDVFTGVTRFSKYDDLADNTDEIIESVYLERKPGEILAINGPTAAKVIAHDFGHQSNTISSFTRNFDSTIPPSGITLKSENIHGRLVEVVEIENSKALKGARGEELRKWILQYGNTGSRVRSPFAIRSKDGHLKGLNYNVLRNELKAAKADVSLKLSNKNIESTQGKFTPVSELDEIAKYGDDYGIIIPYHGENIISSSTARIALPAAGDTSVKINNKINMRDPESLKRWNISFKNMNTQTADAMWLEAKYLVSNDKSFTLTKKVIPQDNIRLMQAAYEQLLRNGEKVNLSYKIQVGKDLKTFDTNNIEQFSELLLEQKAVLAKQVLNAGGNYEQAALYTNLKAADIELLHSMGWNSKEAYAHMDNIGQYISGKADEYATAAPISVLGKHRTYGELEAFKEKQVFDLNTLRDSHTALIRQNLVTSDLPQIQELLDSTLWNEAGILLRDNLETLLQTVDKPSKFLASSDQALRRQGLIGDTVVSIGNRMVALGNKHWKDMGSQLAPFAQKVAQSRTDTLQFEQIKRAIQAYTDPYALKFNPQTRQIEFIGKDGALEYLEGGTISVSQNVADLLSAYIPASKQLYKEMNFLRQNANLPPLPDRGIWFPYEAVEDKFIAFKINKKNPHDLFIITSNSANDLKDQLDIIKRDSKTMADYDLVTRDQISYWSDLLDYSSLNPLATADSSFKKSGIAVHVARADPSGLDDLMGSMHRMLWRNRRMSMKQAGAEIFQKLESSIKVDDSAQLSAAGKLNQKLGQKPSIAEIAYTTMLNTSTMNRSPVLGMVNDITAVKINQAFNVWDNIKAGIKNKGTFTADDFAELGTQAEAKGIPLPWQNFEEYLVAKNASKLQDVAQHRVAQVNGIAATMNLRLMEFSHSILTLLSTPVVLSGQLANAKYPMKEFMDTAKWMMKGDDEYKEIMKVAEQFGSVKPMVSEATDLMANLHTAESLMVSKFKNAIDILSKPSDWAERATREYSYAMGYRLAKQQGITSKDLLHASAHAFTIRAMGNYVSRQRPTLFQGTFGGIIGLYQTFMVTMGQNLYRYVEQVDKRALTALIGAQAGMFGLESLPMYHPFNRLLGEYGSDTNEDITTTIYSAFGNTDDQTRSAAEYLLYGAPSTLFQSGFYTRGELQPRTPLRFEQGIGFMPAGIDNLAQVWNTGFDLVKNVGASIKNDGNAGDWGHAALQSFSVQSVWRPGARYSEILMQRSYDRKGELVSGPEDVVGTGWPLLTRALASRPLKEQVVRNLKFNNSYYNNADKASRQRVIRQVRRAASRGDELSGEEYRSLLDKYVKEGGTSEGWKRIVKQSYQESETPYAERQMKYAKQNEAFLDIFNSYD